MIEEADHLQEDDDNHDLEEGPPGFQSFHSLQSSRIIPHQDDAQDDDDELKGPPPGFSTPPALSLDIKEKNNWDGAEDKDDGPPPGWDLIPPQQCKLPKVSPSSPLTPIFAEIGFHQGGHKFSEYNGHLSKRIIVSPSQKPTLVQVTPSACTTPSEPAMGQLVCGTCSCFLILEGLNMSSVQNARKLILYLKSMR